MARHLLVTNDYHPKTGGIQVYLHELWRRLESGRAVVLTASSHEGAQAFDETSDMVIGIRICGDCVGSIPSNPAWLTPTTVNGYPFSTSFLPITFGSPPKRDIQ